MLIGRLTVPPAIMGIGPVFAIPAVLEKTGLSLKDIDIFEINEAYASQALYCIRTLGIDEKRVNPQGGALALGHPLGVTGARQIVTGLARAKKTGEKILLTSMCAGSGIVRYCCLSLYARSTVVLTHRRRFLGHGLCHR